MKNGRLYTARYTYTEEGVLYLSDEDATDGCCSVKTAYVVDGAFQYSEKKSRTDDLINNGRSLESGPATFFGLLPAGHATVASPHWQFWWGPESDYLIVILQ